MIYALEVIHTYVLVGLIEQYGMVPSLLIFTASTYLVGYPLFLVLQAIAPSKSRFFLAVYCLVASCTGSLPFWVGLRLGYDVNFSLVIPLILLPCGVYYLSVLLVDRGPIAPGRQSSSNLTAMLFLIALFTLPVATVVDWVFFKGQYICAKTGGYSVLLIAFGLPAIGAFLFLLLLMPIVGLVSLLSATVRWLVKKKPIHSES